MCGIRLTFIVRPWCHYTIGGRTIRLYIHTQFIVCGGSREKVQSCMGGTEGSCGMRGKTRSIPAKAGDTLANSLTRNREKEWMKSNGEVSSWLLRWHIVTVMCERLENMEFVSAYLTSRFCTRVVFTFLRKFTRTP